MGLPPADQHVDETIIDLGDDGEEDKVGVAQTPIRTLGFVGVGRGEQIESEGTMLGTMKGRMRRLPRMRSFDDDVRDRKSMAGCEGGVLGSLAILFLF